MRLAVFTNQFPGLVSTFFARDMRGLIEAGIDIDVFPIRPYDSSLWRCVPDILNDKILPKNNVHHLTVGECIKATRLRPVKKIARFVADTALISAAAIRYGPGPLVKSSYVFLKAWTWAQKYGDKFDHVLAYWGNYAGTCAYLFHRLAARPIPFSLFLHAGTDLYRAPLFLRKKLLYADNIVTCSDFNSRFIKEQYSDIADVLADKIHVHYHGLNLTEFSFKSNGRVPGKVIAVGRLEKEKGYHYLIRAAYQLKQSGIDIDVEFAGDGSEVKQLKSLSLQLGLSDRVTFLGWLAPDEVRAVMQRAFVLVHPSPYLGDGVPNVIKECMALGTPVIATPVAGIPELLNDGEHGVLVPPRNVTALAKAIGRLLSDHGMQTAYAQSGRKYAEECFDMWCNGKQLSDVLRRTKRRAALDQ